MLGVDSGYAARHTGDALLVGDAETGLLNLLRAYVHQHYIIVRPKKRILNLNLYYNKDKSCQ